VKRRRLAARARRLWRRIDEGSFATYIRQQSGFLAWILVFCLVGAQIQVEDALRDEIRFSPTVQDRMVEKMARRAVARSLDVVGHGVRVSGVRVWPTQPHSAAQYCLGEDRIEFSPGLLFTADQMLHTSAHETVHAIFDQANLNPYSSDPAWESRLLFEEVTAYVLGGHIAGTVQALQGGDGQALTRRLVAEYRSRCTWSDSGLRRLVWRYATRLGADKIDPEAAYSIAIHYGPPEMVDAIDQICRENPDPWEAAHVVAERYIEPIEE